MTEAELLAHEDYQYKQTVDAIADKADSDIYVYPSLIPLGENTVWSETIMGHSDKTLDLGGQHSPNAVAIKQLVGRGNFLRMNQDKIIQNARASNLLINGSFKVWQRADIYDYTEGEKYHHCVDRWRSRNEGTGVDSNMRVSKDKIGSKNAMKCEIVSRATDLTGVNHMYSAFYPFEKQDIKPLNGEKVTISFLLETNFTGSVGFAFGGLENDVPKTYIDKCDVVSGEVERHVFTIDIPDDFTDEGILDDTGASIIIGLANKGDHETNLLGWNNGSTKQSYVGTSEWVETDGNWIKIASASMNMGDKISLYEDLPYAMELQNCKRYYEEFYNPTASINSYMGNWTLQYSVEKRAVPSVEILEAGSINGDGTSGVVEIVSPVQCRLRVIDKGTSNQWFNQRIAFDAEI